MPNFDGHHYFLTALLPIATDTLAERDGRRISPIQMVRSALASLPVALQTQATEKTGLNSPFSRNQCTHFARFVVIEDAIYNARDREDAIKIALTGINPVLPQPQDSLSCPFLLFAADFDAPSGDLSELTSYLRTLWGTMEPELREVFAHCVGFEEVENGEEFAKYIQRGQIETTMPFNDYWTIVPPLKSLMKSLIAVLMGSILVGSAVGWMVSASFSASIVGGLAGFVIGLIPAYAIVMQVGSQPFPPAPNADLSSILKALYLQQKFTQLAIDVQGANDEVLYKTFATFLTTHDPDAAEPTQHPGVIHS